MSDDKMSRMWNCSCSCGGDHKVSTKLLRNGTTKSCGCLLSSVLDARNRTHGKSKTALYTQWSAMHSRCYNPHNQAYHRYGGRGIHVVERWHNFELFSVDVGPKPVGLSLDRCENDGPYGPDNFRWATATEQNQNRRDNVKIRMVDGTVLVLAEAARVLGVSSSLATYHLKKHGIYKGATYENNSTV